MIFHRKRNQRIILVQGLFPELALQNPAVNTPSKGNTAIILKHAELSATRTRPARLIPVHGTIISSKRR